MPTVLRVDGYRFFFFSNEHNPKHIHIEKGDAYIRIELKSLKITDSFNLSNKEQNKIISIVKLNQIKLINSWNEYFKK